MSSPFLEPGIKRIRRLAIAWRAPTRVVAQAKPSNGIHYRHANAVDTPRAAPDMPLSPRKHAQQILRAMGR